ANGEDVTRVAAMITSFPAKRRADLWTGASFACAYAGSPMQRQALEQLRAAAGPYQAQLAVAGTLAAKRRHGFGHLTPQTELACQVFCGLSSVMAAQLANDALKNIPSTDDASPYQIWRQRILTRFDKPAVHSANKPLVFLPQKEQ
ncbi:MAG TPA: DUF1702 family protein, partial [Ktedonobacteraceae bacterium]|nr:DUF1702 family protein [Ktedonobacteraceae bacterium]